MGLKIMNLPLIFDHGVFDPGIELAGAIITIAKLNCAKGPMLQRPPN